MKIKKFLFLVCAMVMTLCAFTACGDDDDEGGGKGYYGTYATSSSYDNYTHKNFRDVIVLTKSSFIAYSSAVDDRSYWGASSEEVPGLKGWYVDGSSKRTYSYVASDDRIVVENGGIFSIGNNTLVGGGQTYYKQN